MAFDVLQHVRNAAARLVADLEEGARRTDGWTALEEGRPLLTSAVDRCLQQLVATNLWGRANQVPSSALWKIAGDLLQHGELLLRARAKPRGYAGDDVMLAQIYCRHMGNHPLGRLLDEYFQNQDAPCAVRSRIEIAARTVTAHRSASGTDPYHVISFGSGPAIDLELALADWPPEQRRATKITLLDLDQQALDHAQQRLAPLVADDQLRSVRDNLFRLPRRPKRRPLIFGADIVLCLGFLDYLEDEDASALLSAFWESLRPAGVMLVGNFAPHCRSRAYMEWIGNWYLVFRTRQELATLASRAGIPESCFQISADPLGVDLLFQATKPR